jgi:hypothetical protein
MTKADSITAEYVRTVLDYDPETGIFRWKERPREMFASQGAFKTWNKRYAGTRAGYRRRDDYVMIRLPDKSHLAHRLAWLYVHGRFPPEQLDHRNHRPGDNRIANLCLADYWSNSRNRSPNSRNTSGQTGVAFHKRRKKYQAYAQSVDGKYVHLGVFDNINDAIAARKAAEIKYGYHPNHGRAA